MKIAVYQFSPKFGNKKENIKRIENVLQKTQSELIVLPELCTTGYQFTSQKEVAALCEPIPEGDSVAAFIRICREKLIYLVAGIGEKLGQRMYNSAVFVGPKGYMGTYRKIHLFSEEKRWFVPGDTGFTVWDIGKVKIGIMICFDWIFPESARSLAMMGADIICQPANLVLPYCQNAMITRSIENRVFSITANRIGSEERGGREKMTFTGSSQTISPNGEIVFRLNEVEEKFKETEIDPSLAKNKWITPQNHLWHDRRPEKYNLEKQCFTIT